MTEQTETALAVMPTTGEVIDLADLPAVAVYYDELAEMERRLKEAKRWLTDALDAESIRQGTRTLHLDGGITVELTSRTKLEWDHEALAELLAEAGLPHERIDELIEQKITHKVNGNVVRQLRAANEEYAHVLDTCSTEVPATVYVRGVKR